MDSKDSATPSGTRACDFDLASSLKMNASVVSFSVCKQETKPLLYLVLLTKSIIWVLNSSLNQILLPLDDLFPGVELLFISYMFGDLAAVASRDGRVFVLDFIERKVLCDFKAHTDRVLAVDVEGSRIVSAGRDKRRKYSVVVLKFCPYHDGPVLEYQAITKVFQSPDFVKLVTVHDTPSVLALFRASIWSALGLSETPTLAHYYSIKDWGSKASVNMLSGIADSNGYSPLDVALSPNGERYAVVSRKEGSFVLTVGEVKNQRIWNAIIEECAEWASGVTVSWSSLEDRVYFTGRDGYVYTTNVPAAGMNMPTGTTKHPVKMNFTQHIGGVKFVRAFDHDDHEVVVTVGNDDVVNLWTRPITHLTLRL